MTRDEIAAILDYDPLTGVFTWKHREGVPKQWTVRYAGKPAGSVEPRGYIRIRINGKPNYAHRLAWTLMGGGCARDIDHANGDRSDNRIANLRAATRSQNLANTRKNDPTKGVHWNTKRKKFIAQIVCLGKHHWLGEHDDQASAIHAYQTAAAQLFGEFACHLN